MFLKLLGMLVVGGVAMAGIKWVYDNITFKKMPEKYTYRDGAVKDYSELEKEDK